MNEWMNEFGIYCNYLYPTHIPHTIYHIHNITHNFNFILFSFDIFCCFYVIFIWRNFLYSFIWKSIKYLFSQYYWSASRLTAFTFYFYRHRRFSKQFSFAFLFLQRKLLDFQLKMKMKINSNWKFMIQIAVTTIKLNW